MKTEKTGFSGHLTVRVLDKNGKELRVLSAPNVVTNGAKAALAKLLVPATEPDQDDNQFWWLQAGDGSTTPDVTDVALAGSNTYAKDFDTKTYNAYSTDGLVECVVTFGTSEGNGNTYQEAGLWTRGDDGTAGNFATSAGKTMCARQLHASIAKTSSIQLEYTWRFQLTPAP